MAYLGAFQASAFQRNSFQCVPIGGGGSHHYSLAYIQQLTSYEEKKRKTSRPAWDRVKQQKEEALRRAQEPAPPSQQPRLVRIVSPASFATQQRAIPDAPIQVKTQPPQTAGGGDARDFADLSAAFSTIGQHSDRQNDTKDIADLSDAIRQIQDTRDFADISTAFSSINQQQSRTNDNQDMADIADVFGHLSTMVH